MKQSHAKIDVMWNQKLKATALDIITQITIQSTITRKFCFASNAEPVLSLTPDNFRHTLYLASECLFRDCYWCRRPAF
jgi:hypothetical protein